jgi:hypothetical protein
MEKFQELLQHSKDKLEIAEQVVMQTFPMTKDPKLLMNASDNLFLSMTYGMGALLHFEAKNKRMDAFEDKFEDKTNAFEKQCVPRYGIKLEYITVMRRLKGIIVEHHKSAMVFSKNDQLVICGEDYKIRKLGYGEIKRYLYYAGSFHTAMSQIIMTEMDKGKEQKSENGKKGPNIIQKLFMNRKV